MATGGGATGAGIAGGGLLASTAVKIGVLKSVVGVVLAGVGTAGTIVATHDLAMRVSAPSAPHHLSRPDPASRLGRNGTHSGASPDSVPAGWHAGPLPLRAASGNGGAGTVSGGAIRIRSARGGAGSEAASFRHAAGLISTGVVIHRKSVLLGTTVPKVPVVATVPTVPTVPVPVPALGVRAGGRSAPARAARPR